MASISGYDSSSIGVLFSSLNNTRNNNSNSLFSANADILSINYADYASIRNGSYFKLLSAYYSETGAGESVKEALSTSTSKDDTKTLARVENSAADMKESAAELMTSGSKSVFEKVTTKDDKGVETTDYNVDAIYKAVSAFVEDYNSVLDAADDSNTVNILRTARSMVNYSAANEKLLAKVGITIGEGNELEIDEATFKKADMNTVKTLFQTRGSYGYQMQTQAAMMESYAKMEAAKSNTYSSTGTYTYNYNTGELYNSTI